jgi:hypothetical protein
MSDLPRSKYEILDPIIAFLNALCMCLAAIFLLTNITVISIFILVVALVAFLFLFLWITRNPLSFYLVRAFIFNNLFFTSIALLFYFSLLSIITYHPLGYVLFLLPSALYLKFSHKSSAVFIPRENKEEKIQREKLNRELKKEYRYKITIGLAIILTLSSFVALIYGFY